MTVRQRLAADTFATENADRLQAYSCRWIEQVCAHREPGAKPDPRFSEFEYWDDAASVTSRYALVLLKPEEPRGKRAPRCPMCGRGPPSAETLQSSDALPPTSEHSGMFEDAVETCS
jgi:hypothetical protein